MTNHAVRLYALASSLLVLFLVWAVVAAHPWSSRSAPKADPRIHALAIRERHLRHESKIVQRVVRRRWARYQRELARRKKQIAAARRKHRQALAAARAAAAAPAPAPVSSSYSPGYSASPSVQVVTLPPVTITRSS
jgi:hypothetical protein